MPGQNAHQFQSKWQPWNAEKHTIYTKFTVKFRYFYCQTPCRIAAVLNTEDVRRTINTYPESVGRACALCAVTPPYLISHLVFRVFSN